MPPKKQPVAGSSQPQPQAKDSAELGVEDLLLPRTIVQRLAKGVLPPNTQIQKDALLAMSKSATVFINYLSSQANENAHNAQKKTIAPQHVLEALEELEFPGFVPRLKAELEKFNTLQAEKRNAARDKTNQNKKDSKGTQSSDAIDESIDLQSADEEGPAPKKVRFSKAKAANGTVRNGQVDDEEIDADDPSDDGAEALDDAEEGDEISEDDEDENEKGSQDSDRLETLEEPEARIDDPDEALEGDTESD